MARLTREGFGLALITAMVLMLGTAGLCCYSGLLVIPTATTVGDKQYSAELQIDGVVQGMAAQTTLLNNQFGIGDRIELGLDFDLEGGSSTIIGNGKLVAHQSGNFAAAVGVASLARQIRPTPFVVGSLGLGATHVHLGAMRIEGCNRCIAGLEYQLGKLTLMGDYTSGSDGVSSFGFNYQVSESFGVMAGALFPCNCEEDTGFTVHLVWCTHLHGRGD